jgi:hypothetical protein
MPPRFGGVVNWARWVVRSDEIAWSDVMRLGGQLNGDFASFRKIRIVLLLPEFESSS